MDFMNQRRKKDFNGSAWVTQLEGDYDVDVNWFVDGVTHDLKSVSVAGAGATLD